eukprot:259738_1
MAKDLSGPSLFERAYSRAYSVKGVLWLVCLMTVVVLVVMLSRSEVDDASVSVTLYSGSGILFKGFPGGSTHFIEIDLDGSEKPQNVKCADLPNQKEFFLSEAEIDGLSDARKKFYQLTLNVLSRKPHTFGFWTCTTSLGEDDITWNRLDSKIKHGQESNPILKGSDSEDDLILRNVPTHNGPVSLTKYTKSLSGNRVEWNFPLTTDGINTDKAYAVKDLSASHRFESLVDAVRTDTPIFALSKWNGSVEFPIRVDAQDYASYLNSRPKTS